MDFIPCICISPILTIISFLCYFLGSWLLFLLNEFEIITWEDYLYDLYLDEHPSIATLEISIAIVGSVIVLVALICCFIDNKFSIIWLITTGVFLCLNFIYIVYSKGVVGLNGDFDRLINAELEKQLQVRNIPAESQNKFRNEWMEAFHYLLRKQYASILKTFVLTGGLLLAIFGYTIELEENNAVDGEVL